MTPDREVQEAIRSLFFHFERLGSLRQVLLWYHQENVMFPLLRIRDGKNTMVWQLPNYEHLLRILKNPLMRAPLLMGGRNPGS